jgi:signal transduction histidine kinase
LKLKSQLIAIIFLFYAFTAGNAAYFWYNLGLPIYGYKKEMPEVPTTSHHHTPKRKPKINEADDKSGYQMPSKIEIQTSDLLNFEFISVGLFFLCTLFLSYFASRTVFTPLSDLLRKMKNFKDGTAKLFPVSKVTDDISYLDSQFYEMATQSPKTTEFQDLDRAKTDFISVVSHELRTPMTAVKGSLSLILTTEQDQLSNETKEILGIAEKESDRLIRLINDILDLTKMETQQLPLDKKWFDLESVVQSAVEGMQGLFEVTKVRAEIVKPPKPIKAFFDHDRVQQIITNLMSNAVKFSPSGSVITISYAPHPNLQSKGVCIRVKDCGQGIKKDDMDHIFEKFRSTDSGRSKIIKGTGLGLPICKALVEQHGGEIAVQSTEGKGSTFYFTLPEPGNSTSKTKGAAA